MDLFYGDIVSIRGNEKMKNKLCVGTFLRINRVNFTMCMQVIIYITIFSAITWFWGNDTEFSIFEWFCTIAMIQIPAYIGITAIQNVLLGIPKCIFLGTPRKDIHKSMAINDLITVVVALIIPILINLISKGELGLHYTSIDSMLKILLVSMLMISFLEYVMLIFKRYNVYYGLANVFLLIGIGVYFARDIYFLYAGGSNILLMGAVVLIILLLSYVNYILIDGLEIRG